MKESTGFTPLEILKKVFFIVGGSRRRVRFLPNLNYQRKAEFLTGFTLLETLVALFVLSFAFAGPLTLAWLSIRSADSSQNQFIASYLAEEGLEYIKNVRDNNALQGGPWLQGLGLCRDVPPGGCSVDVPNFNITQKCNDGNNPRCQYIKYDSTTGLYNYASGIQTKFTRETKIHDQGYGPYEARVTVEVFWQERLITKSFIIEENIFDWL